MKTEFYIAKRYFFSMKRSEKNISLVFKFLYSISFIYIIRLLLQVIFALLSFSKKRFNAIYKQIINDFIKQNFVRILSNISMVSIGVTCAALIVVLSVFNGLEKLTRDLFRTYNSELKVMSKRGKTFEIEEKKMKKIKDILNIKAITQVIEDNILLHYKDKQMIANVKGVSENFYQQYDLNDALVLGSITIQEDNTDLALVSLGVYHQLSINLNNKHIPLQLWYPNVNRLLNFNLVSSDVFKKKSILPNGVLSIEPQFDASTIIVPIAFTRSLLSYDDKQCSYLEIKTTSEKYLLEIEKQLKEILGDEYILANMEEQQINILRAVQIERLFVFVTFVFILLIASFNIFFSLAILTIEKKKDIAILFSMGATRSFVKKIFLFEGAIISFTGAFFGLFIGGILCWCQEEFGIFNFGVERNILQSYPIKIIWSDFLYISIPIIVITIIVSYIPAHKATVISNGS